MSGAYDIGSFIVEPYQPDEKGIRYDSLGIEVHNELGYAYLPTNPVNSFGFSSVYACSPAVNFDILFDVIITSSEDYNSAYPKGTNLEEIMLARYSYLVRGNNIDAFMVNKQLDESNIFYTFAYPPAQDAYHDLTFKYILADGREYESTVTDVLVKK